VAIKGSVAEILPLASLIADKCVRFLCLLLLLFYSLFFCRDFNVVFEVSLWLQCG
jgi:hypothetical protein